MAVPVKKIKRYKKNRMTGKVNFAHYPEQIVALIVHARSVGRDKSDIFRDAFSEYVVSHAIPLPDRATVIQELGADWAKKNDYKTGGDN